MTKNGTHETDFAEAAATRMDEAARSLLGRGRAVMDQLPDAVEGARGAIGTAQGQVDELSDEGVVAAVAFSAGVTMGLFLAGAPRVILALTLVPTAITLRSALRRGVRPARLVN